MSSTSSARGRNHDQVNQDLVNQDPANPALANLNAPSILNALQKGLGGLNAGVTKAFLTLGATLQSISARCREVTVLSQSAAALTAADDSDQAIATLTEILADTELVQALTQTSQIQMSEILWRLKQTRSPLTHLEKLPDSLNAVGMLSRIKGGRLKGAAVDISHLATDISDLRRRVLRNVNAIAEEAGRLTHMVSTGVQHLDKTKMQEQEQAGNLIEQGRSVLDALLQLSQLRNGRAYLVRLRSSCC